MTTDTVDGAAAWHAWRREGIGGSDIAALLGISNWGSPFTVWQSKVGYAEPDARTERQQMGIDLEIAIAKMFYRHTGLLVAGEQMWVEDPTNPIYRCTIDGLAMESVPDQGAVLLLASEGPVQMKSDGAFGWPDGPPAKYIAQVRWEMGCTGHTRGWLAVIFAGFRFEAFEIEQDPDELERMRNVADVFWRDHVETLVPPEIDGSDATKEALAKMHPEHVPGERVEVPADLIAEWKFLRDDRLEHERAAKAVKEQQQEIENQLRAILGDAELATVDGTVALSFRASKRAGYQVDDKVVRSFRLPTKKESAA